MHTCPVCGEHLVPTKNLLGTDSLWFSECSNPLCNTIVNTGFVSTDYQLEFIADDSQMCGYFGGYGAGKTTSSAMKFLAHILTVPNGESLLGAESWSMMLKTNVKEIAMILPIKLVDTKTLNISMRSSSPAFSFTLKNGHVVYGRVLISEESLRSLNLTGWWIEEASTVRYSLYNQLVTRQRSAAGITHEYDGDGNLIYESFKDGRGILRKRPKEGKPNYLGIISSNPDPGWIRTKFLYKVPTENIHYYGNDTKIETSLKLNTLEKNPFLSAYIVPTTANFYLPRDFIAKNSAGKSKAWVKRYIEGSFSFAEGLVYPAYPEAEVQPFDIPKNWKHLIAADFGRRDPTAYLLGAIDPDSGILYIYKEYYMPEGNMTDWVQGFWDLYNPVSPTSWLMPPIGDPAGESRGQAVETSWFKAYSEYDIHFIPSNTGKGASMGISTGIALVADYMEVGKLKFFSTLTHFKDEISNYKYKTKSLMEADDTSNKDEKPVGYKDHLMDTLRGMVSMLPRNVGTDLGELKPSFVSAKDAMMFAIEDEQAKNDPNNPAFWTMENNDTWNQQDIISDEFGVVYGDLEGDDYDGIF